MKIGINARYIQKQHTGIENYLSNILRNLVSIDTRNEYVLFFGNDKPVPAGYPAGNFSVDLPEFKTDSQLKRVFWEHFYLPGAISKHRLDVFHEPSFISPIFKKAKTLTTVYDLAFIYHPECFTSRNILYFKTMLKSSIRHSDYIIAISQNTKNDIINHFKIDPDRVKVVYCGVNSIFKKLSDKSAAAPTLRKFGIIGDFILNVSLISPRKNLINLIRSFKLLRDRKAINHQLVIAGAKGWLFEDIFRTVSSFGLEKQVIFTEYVTDDELLHLYNNASVFAYPSVYEGFGLPVLEAMACECPVVASNTSSLPEICGEAALLVDPDQIEEIAGAIHKAVSDPVLRNGLITMGKERVQEFSWKKAAEETLNIYGLTNEKSQ